MEDNKDNSERKKRLPENHFFLNKKGEEQYHKQCVKCKKRCKQSWKVSQLICSRYEKM